MMTTALGFVTQAKEKCHEDLSGCYYRHNHALERDWRLIRWNARESSCEAAAATGELQQRGKYHQFPCQVTEARDQRSIRPARRKITEL
jgi:hypothetical protein